MSVRKGAGSAVKTGAAKVYRKNLLRILDNLQETNPVIQKIQFQNFLIQAEDCLVKLKKAEADSYTINLENEYNYHKELFLKMSNPS